ncbi:MAG TPA: hypothetical protein VJ949_02745 [Cryomorphaceae bacterium]|nr:hypothetical protein [Cryomorphaceae bacterium]
MSQEISYRKIVAQAKSLMTKGNVSAYIKELVKAEQARVMRGAI